MGARETATGKDFGQATELDYHVLVMIKEFELTCMQGI